MLGCSRFYLFRRLRSFCSLRLVKRLFLSIRRIGLGSRSIFSEWILPRWLEGMETRRFQALSRMCISSLVQCVLHTLDRMTNSHLPHNLENRPPTLITNLSYLLGLRNLLARNGSASPRMTMTIVFSLLGSISKLLDQLNFLVPHSQNSHLNQTVLFHHARISTLHETSTTTFTFHC